MVFNVSHVKISAGVTNVSGLVVAACDLVFGSLSVVRFVLPLTFVSSLRKILTVCGQRGCCKVQRCLAIGAEGRVMYGMVAVMISVLFGLVFIFFFF